MFVAFLAISGAAPVTAAAATDEQRIEALETAWNEAHLQGDIETLDKLWAPGLSVVVPEMPPFSKLELLQMWRSMKVTFTQYKTTEVEIRLFGTAAVVTGQLHRVRDFGGRAATDDWLFTKTYAKVDGEWKVVAYHASVTPAH